VLCIEFFGCWDRQIQVQLLRDRSLRPRRLREFIDLLERQAGGPRFDAKDEPVLATRVRPARDRRIVPWTVLEPE
jgi:hypothetical protein